MSGSQHGEPARGLPEEVGILEPAKAVVGVSAAKAKAAPLPEGVSRCERGEKIVFDFEKQAWWPYDGEPLDENRTAVAVLKQAAQYDTGVGMRSHGLNFEITERYKKPDE